MPMLFMMEPSNLGEYIICYGLNAILLFPAYPFVLPVMGIPWSPFAALISGYVSVSNRSKDNTESRLAGRAFLYSMISILLWWHLNQRIRQRRFSKETITFGYLVIYGQWALWPGFFVYIAVSPSALPALHLEPLFTGATLCGLVWLLSLFRLYRARWDPTLRTPDPEHSPPDILPAPVYVMPLAFANAWLLWIGAFLINQLVTGWLSIPLFIACMAWIIWDWRRMKA